MRKASLLSHLTLSLFVLQAVGASSISRAEVHLDTAASHFGRMPAVWAMRLSPDGQKVSYLQYHPEGLPIAKVTDLGTGESNLVLASDKKKGVDLTGCEWANPTRLLCKYFGVWRLRGSVLPATRLVAVDIDGKNIQVLVQRQQQRNNEFALHQSEIVDRLPDDPKNIWLRVREKNGMGVSRVDIYRNRLKTIERPQQGIWAHISDGHGELRIRKKESRSHWEYEYRLAGKHHWKKLHRYRPDDDQNIYSPARIAPGSNELFVWDWHEGRRALFKEWLVDDSSQPRRRELVRAHDQVDLLQISGIGESGRPSGVAYRTDRPHVEYFDEKIKAIDQSISEQLPDRIIEYLDESWDRRFYLVHASNDVDPGAYYRYDAASDALSRIARTHPWLEDVDLAQMTPIRFPAADGVSVPGYLSDSSPGKAGGFGNVSRSKRL